jgi:hypothetical protein
MVGRRRQTAASCQKLAGRMAGWLQGWQRTPAVGAVDWVVREEGAHAGAAAVDQQLHMVGSGMASGGGGRYQQ